MTHLFLEFEGRRRRTLERSAGQLSRLLQFIHGTTHNAALSAQPSALGTAQHSTAQHSTAQHSTCRTYLQRFERAVGFEIDGTHAILRTLRSPRHHTTTDQMSRAKRMGGWMGATQPTISHLVSGCESTTITSPERMGGADGSECWSGAICVAAPTATPTTTTTTTTTSHHITSRHIPSQSAQLSSAQLSSALSHIIPAPVIDCHRLPSHPIPSHRITCHPLAPDSPLSDLSVPDGAVAPRGATARTVPCGDTCSELLLLLKSTCCWPQHEQGRRSDSERHAWASPAAAPTEVLSGAGLKALVLLDGRVYDIFFSSPEPEVGFALRLALVDAQSTYSSQVRPKRGEETATA